MGQRLVAEEIHESVGRVDYKGLSQSKFEGLLREAAAASALRQGCHTRVVVSNCLDR